MVPPTDEEDFASLLAEYEQKQGTDPKSRRRDPRVGDKVQARVVSIGQDAVFVDLGAKAEGMIDVIELRDEAGKLTVAVGDVIDARVVEVGGKAGCAVLRRAAGVLRGSEAKAELEQAAAHGIPIEGLVTGVNKGGVEVQVAGVRAFCPISQLDLAHVADAAPFIGQRLSFRITRLESAGKHVNLVVSRRALLEEEQRARAAETRKKLAVGAVLDGTVTNLRDYGAFVDLGGIEGMIHVSELGFTRVAHPREVLQVGQPVQVQVLAIEAQSDPKKPEKIALSLKSLEKDPWAGAPEIYPEGRLCEGKVVRVETYGAFVELAPGVEGLVHVSELGGGRNVKHPREVVRPGQTVQVTVLACDVERRRISLSLGARGDEIDAEGAAKATAPSSFGTLGDLLKKKR